MHEQDSVVARHKSANYTCTITCMLYSTLSDTCVHCSHDTHNYLAKFVVLTGLDKYTSVGATTVKVKSQ